MAFDVASVKPSKMPRVPNFPLNNMNAETPGGRFSAGLGLQAYIGFAYKLGPAEVSSLPSQLPKWASAESFLIEARAEGNPTKDQMRLMMQSLLAERFKLAVHFETQDVPVFALTLVKPGTTGPKLHPHAEGPPCPEFTALAPGPTPLNANDVFPPNCDTSTSWERNGRWLVGSRNTTMPLLADAISMYGAMAGELDKPVVDRTGLQGRFDFTVEYIPDPARNRFVRPGPLKDDAPPLDTAGPTFLEAVRKQLGLKLVSSKAPIRMLVVDHIERPSDN